MNIDAEKTASGQREFESDPFETDVEYYQEDGPGGAQPGRLSRVKRYPTTGGQDGLTEVKSAIRKDLSSEETWQETREIDLERMRRALQDAGVVVVG